MSIRSICVYCGSSSGTHPSFKETAYQYGKFLAENSLTVVYGGGAVGLMGAVADGALEAGGHVIGVIPEALKAKEVDHKGVSQMFVVSDMHQRKNKMATLSDAFVALPGGVGTLEEIFEVYTWKQLNFHTKPCAFYNVEGYYDTLIQFLEESVRSGFVKQSHLDALIVESDAGVLMEKIITSTHLMEWKL